MAPSCTSLTTNLWHLPKRDQQHQSHATTDCLDAASYNNPQRLPVFKYNPPPQAQARAPASSRQAPGGPSRSTGTFHQHGSHVAPCCSDLSDSRVQEVQKHLQSRIPQLPQLDLLRESCLSSKGTVQFSGVNPDWVVVRQGIVDAGGCGMIILAKFQALPGPGHCYKCVIKTVKPQFGQCVDNVKACADREYGKMREADERGVSHAVEPLGVYHVEPHQS